MSGFWGSSAVMCEVCSCCRCSGGGGGSGGVDFMFAGVCSDGPVCWICCFAASVGGDLPLSAWSASVTGDLSIALSPDGGSTYICWGCASNTHPPTDDNPCLNFLVFLLAG